MLMVRLLEKSCTEGHLWKGYKYQPKDRQQVPRYTQSKNKDKKTPNGITRTDAFTHNSHWGPIDFAAFQMLFVYASVKLTLVCLVCSPSCSPRLLPPVTCRCLYLPPQGILSRYTKFDFASSIYPTRTVMYSYKMSKCKLTIFLYCKHHITYSCVDTCHYMNQLSPLFA